jgi:exodeoxyribonuclease VII large subunit
MNSFGGVDVLIVARGGGSLEDLWPFNEEKVARAIAASTIPVVSAVGHEVDVTIADFVADLRAPTPTAAAELVVKDRESLLDILRNSCYRIDHGFTSMLSSRRDHIHHLVKSYAFNRPIDLLRRHSQHLDELAKALGGHVSHFVALSGARTRALADRLRALDPAVALRRGFAIVRKDRRIVTSSQALRPQDRITVEFSDGEVQSTIN